MKQRPLLVRGDFFTVYVVTRYTNHGDGRITAHERHDVTDQYEALVSEGMPTVSSEPEAGRDR